MSRKKRQKSAPTISVEEILNKVNKTEKKNILYAKARWEFLIRNKDFINDNKKYIGETIKFYEKHGRLPRLVEFKDKESPGYKLTKKMFYKWRAPDPYKILPGLSFEKQILIWFEVFMITAASEDEALMFACRFVSGQICNKFADMIRNDAPIYYSLYEPYSPFVSEQDLSLSEDLKDRGLLTFTVSLTHSKKRLMDSFEKMIDEVKSLLEKECPKKTKASNKYYFDLYPRYIKVYDLRVSDELAFKEIAKRVYPGEYKTEPKNTETKVKQHYKEAKRLIKDVAHF